MSERNRRERQLTRYGQCLNEECEKCKSKEIQRIPMRKDFVCEVCGKPLHEVQPPHSWFDKNRKTVVAAIVAVVLIGGGIAWFSIPDDSPASKLQPVADSVVVNKTDTAKISSQTKVTAAVEEEQSKVEINSTKSKKETTTEPVASKPKTESAASNGTRLKCGKYEGPMSGGKPDGIGGTITVTSSYTIDLKDGNGGKVTLESGDRISNTKFKNGVLQQGQLIRSNGERKFMSGLSERL